MNLTHLLSGWDSARTERGCPATDSFPPSELYRLDLTGAFKTAPYCRQLHDE